MALNDYQLQHQGLVMGPTTSYIVKSWSGYGSPTYRTSDDPIPMDHGEWTGPEFLSGRTLTLDVVVRGDTEAGVVTNLDALIQAWYLDTRENGYSAASVLKIKLPGQVERQLFGRPRRIEAETDGIKGTNANAKLEFFASDPRWYSTDLHSTSITFNSAASGRGYNSAASGRSYNYGYGGAGQSNAVQVINAGNFPTRPSLRIVGPVSNPYVTNETVGQTLYITYDLPSGEYLDIDFANRTVVLNGSASRYYAKSGDWFELVAGTNNIRFGVGATSGSPQASLSWRDAWL